MKITIAHRSQIRTFDQYAQGESLDEFRSRVLMTIPDGEEYIWWEQEGHRYSGPVGEHCLGTKYVKGGCRIPGLFTLVQGTVYDYRETPR